MPRQSGAGYSSYPRLINFRIMREIADEVDARRGRGRRCESAVVHERRGFKTPASWLRSEACP
jgi:hypothetical protein